MVDTNSDPREVEYVIPANDDASKSIDKILSLVTAAVIDGLANRTSDGSDDSQEGAEVAEVETAEVAAAPAVVEEVVAAPVEAVADETPEAEAKTEE